MYIDSHCHLTMAPLAEREAGILADMAAARVVGALCICTAMEEAASVQALAARHDHLWASVGVHPETGTEDLPASDAPNVLRTAEPDVAQLCTAARRPKVVAIGETGLDYYRLNGRSVADMGWQRERFRVHIRAARASNLPLIIHTRSASDDTLRLLREEGGDAVGGVFHCFTETMEVARQALDLGFHISFSGILTFRNAQDLRDVARMVPLDRCLIETDSPYLAPVPYRGKTNTPALVPWVAAEMARAKGCSAEQIGRATGDNFERLFAVKVPGWEALPCSP
jgi:TatD DNase family protein